MRYFSFQEMERSDTAYRHGIDNSMPESLKGNVAALVDNVLDPLREAWGGPIDVTSGYRCAALNKAVGGSKTSQHMRGEAADIRIYKRDSRGKIIKDRDGRAIVDTVANRKMFQMVIDLGLPYDQLIDECGFSWVHVSYRADGRNRGEVLKL